MLELFSVPTGEGCLSPLSPQNVGKLAPEARETVEWANTFYPDIKPEDLEPYQYQEWYEANSLARSYISELREVGLTSEADELEGLLRP